MVCAENYSGDRAIGSAAVSVLQIGCPGYDIHDGRTFSRRPVSDANSVAGGGEADLLLEIEAVELIGQYPWHKQERGCKHLGSDRGIGKKSCYTYQRCDRAAPYPTSRTLGRGFDRGIR